MHSSGSATGTAARCCHSANAGLSEFCGEIVVPIQLFDDENPEGREEANLGIQQQEGSAADFDLAANVNTRLVILDDGDSKYF